MFSLRQKIAPLFEDREHSPGVDSFCSALSDGGESYCSALSEVYLGSTTTAYYSAGTESSDSESDYADAEESPSPGQTLRPLGPSEKVDQLTSREEGEGESEVQWESFSYGKLFEDVYGKAIHRPPPLRGQQSQKQSVDRSSPATRLCRPVHRIAVQHRPDWANSTAVGRTHHRSAFTSSQQLPHPEDTTSLSLLETEGPGEAAGQYLCVDSYRRTDRYTEVADKSSPQTRLEAVENSYWAPNSAPQLGMEHGMSLPSSRQSSFFLSGEFEEVAGSFAEFIIDEGVTEAAKKNMVGHSGLKRNENCAEGKDWDSVLVQDNKRDSVVDAETGEKQLGSSLVFKSSTDRDSLERGSLETMSVEDRDIIDAFEKHFEPCIEYQDSHGTLNDGYEEGQFEGISDEEDEEKGLLNKNAVLGNYKRFPECDETGRETKGLVRVHSLSDSWPFPSKVGTESGSHLMSKEMTGSIDELSPKSRRKLACEEKKHDTDHYGGGVLNNGDAFVGRRPTDLNECSLSPFGSYDPRGRSHWEGLVLPVSMGLDKPGVREDAMNDKKPQRGIKHHDGLTENAVLHVKWPVESLAPSFAKTEAPTAAEGERPMRPSRKRKDVLFNKGNLPLWSADRTTAVPSINVGVAEHYLASPGACSGGISHGAVLTKSQLQARKDVLNVDGVDSIQDGRVLDTREQAAHADLSSARTGEKCAESVLSKTGLELPTCDNAIFLRKCRSEEVTPRDQSPETLQHIQEVQHDERCNTDADFNLRAPEKQEKLLHQLRYVSPPSDDEGYVFEPLTPQEGWGLRVEQEIIADMHTAKPLPSTSYRPSNANHLESVKGVIHLPFSLSQLTGEKFSDDVPLDIVSFKVVDSCDFLKEIGEDPHIVRLSSKDKLSAFLVDHVPSDSNLPGSVMQPEASVPTETDGIVHHISLCEKSDYIVGEQQCDPATLLLQAISIQADKRESEVSNIIAYPVDNTIESPLLDEDNQPRSNQESTGSQLCSTRGKTAVQIPPRSQQDTSVALHSLPATECHAHPILEKLPGCTSTSNDSLIQNYAACLATKLVADANTELSNQRCRMAAQWSCDKAGSSKEAETKMGTADGYGSAAASSTNGSAMECAVMCGSSLDKFPNAEQLIAGAPSHLIPHLVQNVFLGHNADRAYTVRSHPECIGSSVAQEGSSQPSTRSLRNEGDQGPLHGEPHEGSSARKGANEEEKVVPLRKDDVKKLIGRKKGIQGHHNSCYLDATLFAMFACTDVFDCMLYRKRRPDDISRYDEVRSVLKDDIVFPLRREMYVKHENVMKLRCLLDQLGSVSGLTSEEKDPEEFLSSLLQILGVAPFVVLSSGQNTHLYQLFVEKDKYLEVPTVQQLFHQSVCESNIKLQKVPARLIIQMPRFGKQFKVYTYIVPSLKLDVTDILEDFPRSCFVCGRLATYECRQCFRADIGLEGIGYCGHCCTAVHQHHERTGHKPHRLNINQDYKEGSPVSRTYMDLFAVVCIETSHYVCFVKCGDEEDAPWCFFDSMADREGGEGGHNIPEVKQFHDFFHLVDDAGTEHLRGINDEKQLPVMARRLVCDAYMCLYKDKTTSQYE